MTVNNDVPHKRVFDLPQIERLHYGRGCTRRLAAAVEERGAKRILLVTSPSISRGPIGEAVRERLTGLSVMEFSSVKSHVPAETVMDALAMGRESQADMVISLGGGSAVDTAKAVAMAANEPVSTEEELSALRVHGEQRITPLVARPLPHIAIPTTLGSSEFTYSYTITNSVSKVKDMYWERGIAPVVAFLDADLAIHTPDWLWAATGLNTIDHCVEWFLSLGRNPFNDALCLDALRMLWDALPESVGSSRSADARQQCQVANWMSAFGALNVGGGLSHAIGHHLGARTRISHVAITLPEVVKFNRPSAAERQALLARAIGIDTQDAHAAAEELEERIRGLAVMLGLPTTLREAGVGDIGLDGVAEATMNDPLLIGNPRDVTAADVEAILAAVR